MQRHENLFLFILAVLTEYTGFPPSNITYKGDYYALVANNRLEIVRCSIYNYLVHKLGMPLASNIILTPGLSIK